MSDEIKWILIYGAILFLLMMTIALCTMAGKWNDAEGVKEDDEEQQDTINT